MIHANRLFERLGLTSTQIIIWRDQPFWNIVMPFIAIFGGLAVYTTIQLYMAWVFGDWGTYPYLAIATLVLGGIGGVFMLLWLALMLFNREFSFASFFHRYRAAAQARRALLAALKAPDDVLMPVIPFTPSTITQIPHREFIGPLHKFKSIPNAASLWLLVILSILILAAIMTQSGSLSEEALHGTAQTYTVFNASADQSTQFLLALLLFYFFMLLIMYVVYYRAENRHIHVDETGIHWRHYGKVILLAWSDIRTIGFYNQNPSTLISAGYVIASDDALISWGLDNTLELGYARGVAATHRLLSLAVTRTELPIRDITSLVLALSCEIPPTPRLIKKAGGDANVSPVLSEEVVNHAARFFEAAAAPAPVARRIPRVLAVLLLIGLIVAPYLAVNVVHDKVLPSYLATLPAHLHRQSPLLQESLHQPGGDWPVSDKPPTTFANGSYTVANDGFDGTVLLPPIYHAVAIQVTMRMITPIPTASMGAERIGAGIIMRGHPIDGGSYIPNCAFLITTTGDWRDSCAYAPGNGNGHSSYIHTGVGAVNTLLAIVRGQFAAFYINSHYVGSFFDSSNPPLGQIGLMNQTLNTTAAFTDFTVWSVKPPWNLAFV